MRKGLCFLEYSDGGCTNPMMHEQTRMVCCCSMGHAWGTPCQECPHPESSKYHLTLKLLVGQKNNVECMTDLCASRLLQDNGLKLGVGKITRASSFVIKFLLDLCKMT